MKRVERSKGLRAFNALCAITLLLAGGYILIVGFHVASVAALICATAGVATPVLLSGEGVLEMLMGILEAVLDGIMAIIEAIVGALASLFG